MSSASRDVEASATRQPLLTALASHKWKLVLSAILIVGAVATIAACAAVLVVASSGGSGDRERGEDRSSRSVHHGFTEEVSFHIYTRNGKEIRAKCDS